MGRKRNAQKGEKTLRIREPNTLIEAKQRMSREEAILWLWNLVATKFFSDRNGKILSLEEVEEAKKRKELIYAVSYLDLNELREKFPDVFTKDKIKYLHKVLRKMQKKIVFEVKIEDYVQMLKDLGFEYLIKSLQIPVGNKVKYYAISTIMSMAIMENGLQIVYTPYVAPLLLFLKKRFTTYDFVEIVNLNSRHSIILYRLFKEKLGLKKNKFTLTIEELKGILGVEKTSKDDLKRKILIPAIGEINQKTSLKVSFIPIRKGRGGKIVAFRFEIKQTYKLPTPEEILSIEDLKELLSLVDILSIRKVVVNNNMVNSFLPINDEEILEDFDYTDEEVKNFKVELIAYKLLSLKRINPAVVLWYLLHFPRETHPQLWEKIRIIDNNEKKFKYPENFLLKEINKDKRNKDDLDFLLEERIKVVIPTLLKEIVKPYIEYLERKTKLKEANLLIERIKEISSKLSDEQKLEVKEKIKEKFHYDGQISEIVKEFWNKTDVNNLKEIKEIFEDVYLKDLKCIDELL